MPWGKGQSGNPSGRKKGVANKELTTIRGQSESIINRVIEQANEGCVHSQKMVLDRIVAPMRSVEAPVILFGYPVNGSMLERGEFLLRATVNGKMSIQQGASLISALSSLCGIAESSEFKEKLERLEAQVEQMADKK